MDVLVEGLGPDAIAVAELLASEGADVRLAGVGPAPPAALALRALGVRVVEHADLDAFPGEAEVAYLDAWTPAVAPRVGRLRAAGARISSIGDLVLARSPAPVVGVTGTAGKTTTAALVTQLLGCGGLAVLSSDASPAANRWPSADLLARLPSVPADGRVVVELTSSHLAFMATSPRVAVVTTFWPDHLELHGSLAAYRTAKEVIVRHQTAGDVVVVDSATPAVARFASLTPAAGVPFAERATTGARVWLDGEAVVVDDGGRALTLPLPGQRAFRGPRAVNVVAACAAALAAGVEAASLEQGLASASAPRWRAGAVGSVGGVEIVDDGMAATPTKALASLVGRPGRSVVLLCGGRGETAGGAAHATPLEREALERACDEAARVARAVVVFGAAGDRLERMLRRRGVEAAVTASLEEGVGEALARAGGAGTLLFAPMFPVAASDRARFAALATGASGPPLADAASSVS